VRPTLIHLGKGPFLLAAAPRIRDRRFAGIRPWSISTGHGPYEGRWKVSLLRLLRLNVVVGVHGVLLPRTPPIAGDRPLAINLIHVHAWSGRWPAAGFMPERRRGNCHSEGRHWPTSSGRGDDALAVCSGREQTHGCIHLGAGRLEAGTERHARLAAGHPLRHSQKKWMERLRSLRPSKWLGLAPSIAPRAVGFDPLAAGWQRYPFSG